MGLEGTLRVFSLNDIFQVLGLQRKSGVLTVEGEDDTVTISFLGGQVVAAESAQRRLDNRIGNLLVRAGRISEEQLARILQTQAETQQRLGFLLIRDRVATPADLREALRLQILRIVFNAFRWTDGRFSFTQEGPIDYDADHMSPVPTESILMEAAQMQDEWPILERKIPSREIVYRRAPGVENLRLISAPEPPAEGSLVVSRKEAETWKWVDGTRTISEIQEHAFLSEFDVYKGLVELLDRSLLVEGRIPVASVAPAAAPRPAGFSSRAALLWVAAALLVAAGVFLAPRNPWNLFVRPRGERREAADFLKSVSLERLAAIERAVRVFYDSSGQYPKKLEDLVTTGILDESGVYDPYGRKYRYILRTDDGKFGLYGRNAQGEIDLDLSFDRSLAPVAEIHPARSRGRAPESRPGVQVIE
ncbi:MAG: DUF4388 domain-containing protein [Acidobacteria bacterium]|nr:DUF4388 domain-containing protein [Acidobacteriota bacterium]MCA1610880.1 DUF4388 domain-containing protein [Acidobacteriota bacterium]MCA1617308.1 DUF4388 domain-containing protein [Acidobacteriota bacterium]